MRSFVEKDYIVKSLGRDEKIELILNILKNTNEYTDAVNKWLDQPLFNDFNLNETIIYKNNLAKIVKFNLNGTCNVSVVHSVGTRNLETGEAIVSYTDVDVPASMIEKYIGVWKVEYHDTFANGKLKKSTVTDVLVKKPNEKYYTQENVVKIDFLANFKFEIKEPIY